MRAITTVDDEPVDEKFMNIVLGDAELTALAFWDAIGSGRA